MLRIGNWDVFVTQRYDRSETDGRWRRRHQEDLCQALAVPPAKKHQHRDGGPGVAAIARLIRSFPLADDRAAAGHAFYRALVFAVIGGCTDAHAKNFSLLHDGRSVRLAPLSDLLSFAGYWDGPARIDSALSIGGEYSLRRIAAPELAAVGGAFGVRRDQADAIVDSTRR